MLRFAFLSSGMKTSNNITDKR